MVHNIDDFLKAGPLDRTVHAVNGFYKKDKKKANGKSYLKSDKHHHKATLEIPVQLDGAKGFTLKNESRLAVSTSFPVYSTNADDVTGSRQDVHCRLSSLTALHGKIGYTTGSANVSFNHYHGSTINCSLERRTTVSAGIGVPKSNSSAIFSTSNTPTSTKVPALHIGFSTKKNSALGAEITFPKPSIDLSQCLISFSASKPTKLRNNTLKMQTNLSSSFSPFPSLFQSTNLNFALQPAYSNNKEETEVPIPSCNIKLGWSRIQKSYRPNIGMSISAWLPTTKEVCSKKLLDLSVTWRGKDSWQLGAMWTQMQVQDTKKATAKRHVRVGVNLAKQLTWIFNWTEGDLKLQVPIFVSSSATPMFYFKCLYHFFFLSFLSHTIQDMLGHIIMSKRMDESADRQKEMDPVEKIQKARQDAMQQQNFMKRQANIRTKSEREIGGLVIKRAVYYVRWPGMSLENSKDTLDVTVPLQFWVSDSKLEFYEAARRSNMLGFCNLLGGESTLETSNASTTGTRNGTKAWLSALWYDGEQDTVQSSSSGLITAVPEMKVWYDYAERSYEITIGDDEEITLPSSRATLT
jgi:hypothetical protein